MLPDFERADAIGSYWGNPATRAFGELLIDCKEDRTLRAVLVGMPREFTPPLAQLDHPRAVGAEQRTEPDLHRPLSDMCDSPAMRWSSALAKAVAAIVVFTSCTSDAQPEQAASPEPPTASPSPTKPPRLPLTEARLAGKYDVKIFVTSNSFDSKPAQSQVFRFIPKCDIGACDVTVAGSMALVRDSRIGRPLEPRSDLTSALPVLGEATEERRSTSGPRARTNPTRIAGPSRSGWTRRSPSMMSGRWSVGRERGREWPTSRAPAGLGDSARSFAALSQRSFSGTSVPRSTLREWHAGNERFEMPSTPSPRSREGRKFIDEANRGRAWLVRPARHPREDAPAKVAQGEGRTRARTRDVGAELHEVRSRRALGLGLAPTLGGGS
jgi:hypothetical protein